MGESMMLDVRMDIGDGVESPVVLASGHNAEAINSLVTWSE
jgi:hypothetical protein